MKSFYNIHDLAKIAVDSDSVNFSEHKNYLRFFEVSELKNIDRIPSLKIYEPTLLPIQQILLSRGATFVHSLGIEINGKGIIFPAGGGVGKTSLVSHLRFLPGFRFFGDDFVIVMDDGVMHSFPSDFSIYPYHLDLFPEIKNMEAGKFLKNRKYLFWFYFTRKAINYLAKRMHLSRTSLVPGWNAKYAKVPAEKLVSKEKIGSSVNISTSVFLERYPGEMVIKKEISSTETINKILKVLKKELGLVDTNLERTKLTMAFSRIKCYHLLLPNKLSNEDYFKLMDDFLKTI